MSVSNSITLIKLLTNFKDSGLIKILRFLLLNVNITLNISCLITGIDGFFKQKQKDNNFYQEEH